MKIVFYGNCQLIIGSYTIFKKYIDTEYHIIQSYNLIYNKLDIPVNILKEADIFIYQPINEKYGIYSIDNNIKKSIITYLKDDCNKICVPYLYFDSFFPLCKKNFDDGYDGGNLHIYNNILNNESILKLKKLYSYEEIIHKYNNYDIDFNFKNRFEENINRLLEKEKLCNVKVSDFILNNYKKMQLFEMHHHPTSILIIYFTQQIFNYLNINIEIDKNIIIQLSENKFPISKYVIDYFKFEFINNEEINSHDYYLNLINLSLEDNI